MNMKKTITALCLVLAATAGVHAQAKLGHIDRQQLMLSLPERKEAEGKMQAFAKQLDDRLKAMGEEYKTKLTTAQGNADKMTQTERETATRELSELEDRIQKANEQAKEDLAKQEQELLAPMVERTEKAIKDVATEGNYTYIFDSSTGMVLFYDKGDDIMPQVKKKLNIP